ncbi:secreted RxLR effector protein 161-like [Vicia villosa]|uniref:secreted RxLR effector protein 161-like n=1 Tax=Vicia villosa TaxID=3911 RepID=UPI00273CBFF1|nr:secreted RxLR effector protein 161-like [Vicia villosa]
MIRSILYLTASHPNITFCVGVCALYQANPKMINLIQAKRMIKYIKETRGCGIMYSYDTNSILVEYCDVDWEGNAKDRKTTSGGFFFLRNNLILWFSKKKNGASLSTTEVEYIIVGRSCAHLLWMKQMLKEYNVSKDVMPLHCDNVRTINISKNPV